MKKTLFAVLVMGTMGLTFAACGSGSQHQQETDTTLSNADIDSITEYYGRVTGGFLNSQIVISDNQDDSIKVNKEQFLKGINIVLGQEELDDDLIAGISAGLQISHDIRRFKEQGINMDVARIKDLIAENVLADSVSESSLTNYQRRLQSFIEKADEKRTRRDELAAANSAKGVANNNAGLAAVKKVKAANPQAITTKSGMVAVIENVGEGDIDNNRPLSVDVVYKHIDGSVIRNTPAAQLIPRSANPAISEALSMLKVGGKGTFYLTPDLAFGKVGSEQFGIGPMEWVILEIKVNGNIAVGGEADVTPAVSRTIH